MSSTNRSNARDSHVADYYVTPVSAIMEFLTAYFNDTGDEWRGKSILDPCAGGSANTPMSYPTALHRYRVIGLFNSAP